MGLDNIEASFEFDPLYKLCRDPRASCTGCDPAAI